MGRYVGKYSKKRRIPLLSWLLIVILVIILPVGGVAAYLSAQTDEVTNTFAPETAVRPTISETMESNVKSNVSVNVGNPEYAVYVRAAVVITWKDKDGNVLGEAPQDNDYSIQYNKTDWFAHGGFWYCRSMVTEGNSPVLIESCRPLEGNTPAGYGLNVEIVAQTIQALGTTDVNESHPKEIPAVQDAWGVYVGTDGKLTTTAPVNP